MLFLKRRKREPQTHNMTVSGEFPWWISPIFFYHIFCTYKFFFFFLLSFSWNAFFNRSWTEGTCQEGIWSGGFHQGRNFPGAIFIFQKAYFVSSDNTPFSYLFSESYKMKWECTQKTTQKYKKTRESQRTKQRTQKTENRQKA